MCRLRFIRRAQELGSLRQVAELLDLRMEPGGTCGEVKVRAEKHLREVDEKLEVLCNIRAALEQLITFCDENQLVGDCPIVLALDSADPRALLCEHMLEQ